MDALPWGPDDENTPAGIETTIFAEPVRPARGKVLEEMSIERERGQTRTVVVDSIRDGDDVHDTVVEIKREPGS